MTQPAFGQDLSCLQDEDAVQSEVNGFTALAQALARRLQTPRGTLLGDSSYGYFVIGEIDDDVTAADVAKIGTSIDAEFVKDQRVLSSFTSANFGAGVLVTQSTINTTAGPWTLTLAISNIIAVLGLGPQGGGVIQPIASNNFIPTSLFGCVLWLRSDLGITVATGVSAWTDQSVAGNNVTQASGGSQPAYSPTGGVFGLPKLTFSAHNLAGSTSPVSAGADRTIVAFVQASSTGGGILCLRTGGVQSSFYYYSVSPTRIYSDEVAINNTIAAAFDTTKVHCFIWTWSAGTVTLSIDGVSQAVSGGVTSADTGSAHMVIGLNAGVIPWVGDMYEIITYSRVITGTEQTAINAYGTARYGT